MNKLDLHTTSLTYSVHSKADRDSVRRFVVLVPNDMDYSAAARRVWKLANETGIYDVQLLGLCKQAEEPEIRRRLITMALLLQDARIVVETHVDIGTSWVEAVRSHWQAEDMLVCCAEQHTGLLHRPLSQILQSDLDAPLYVLTGLSPQNDAGSSWLAQAVAWMGSIAIIAGFFVLQTRITLLTDWSQTILMLLAMGVEVWAVWSWNRLFD